MSVRRSPRGDQVGSGLGPVHLVEVDCRERDLFIFAEEWSDNPCPPRVDEGRGSEELVAAVASHLRGRPRRTPTRLRSGCAGGCLRPSTAQRVAFRARPLVDGSFSNW